MSLQLLNVKIGICALYSARLSLDLIRYNSNVAKTPMREYIRLVNLGLLRDDEYQRKVIGSLSHLHDSLLGFNPPKVVKPSPLDQVGWRNTYLGKLICKNNKLSYDRIAKGIYLYGDVGCGKTMLMDIFYSTIPAHLSKKRIHFHQFMQYVHKRSHEIMKEQNLDALGEAKGKRIDSIPLLAAEIAKKWQVLCFDEFQVTDIADAMLLRRVLAYLFSNKFGVVLFVTSNRKPDDLYANGIQRKSFIPCIQLLKNRTKVVYLNSPTDYRKVPKPISHVYYYPEGGLQFRSENCLAARTRHVDTWYDYFAQMEKESSKNKDTFRKTTYNYALNVWGRPLLVPKCVPGRVAQFTFKELCALPLAAGDYLILTNCFKAFIVTDIPYLTVYIRDQVRRFITFIDAVYDNNCKLASTAAASYNELFVRPENLENDYKLKDTLKVENQKSSVIKKKDVTYPIKGHGFSKNIGKKTGMTESDEEIFALNRALSRLFHMGTTEWLKNTTFSK